MISTVILGIFLEIVGALIGTYNIAQGTDHWPWALIGAGVMVAGLIILYAGFRPVVM